MHSVDAKRGLFLLAAGNDAHAQTCMLSHAASVQPVVRDSTPLARVWLVAESYPLHVKFPSLAWLVGRDPHLAPPSSSVDLLFDLFVSPLASCLAQETSEAPELCFGVLLSPYYFTCHNPIAGSVLSHTRPTPRKSELDSSFEAVPSDFLVFSSVQCTNRA